MLKQTHFSHWQELEDTQRSGIFSSTEYVILTFSPTGKECATDNSCPVSYLVCIKKNPNSMWYWTSNTDFKFDFPLLDIVQNNPN